MSNVLTTKEFENVMGTIHTMVRDLQDNDQELHLNEILLNELQKRKPKAKRFTLPNDFIMVEVFKRVFPFDNVVFDTNEVMVLTLTNSRPTIVIE